MATIVFRNFSIAKASIFLFLTSSVSAFWRLLCDGSVGVARIDPLIAPGGLSDHVHSIKGGSGKLALFSSYGYLVASLLTGDTSLVTRLFKQVSSSLVTHLQYFADFLISL